MENIEETDLHKKIINHLFQEIRNENTYLSISHFEESIESYKKIIKVDKNAEIIDIYENFDFIFNNEEFFNLKIKSKSFYIEKFISITININHEILEGVINKLNPEFTNLSYQFKKVLYNYQKLNGDSFTIDTNIYNKVCLNYPEFIYNIDVQLITNLIYDYFYEYIKDKLTYFKLVTNSKYLNKSLNKKIIKLIFTDINEKIEVNEYIYCKIIDEITYNNINEIINFISSFPNSYLLVKKISKLVHPINLNEKILLLH